MNVRAVALDERETDVAADRCLLCGKRCPAGLAATLDHLRDAHGFVVPLPDRCRDVPGLYAYLCMKINGLLCLVCGERTPRKIKTLEALRAHMTALHHDALVLGPEYAEFYVDGDAFDDGCAAPASVLTAQANNLAEGVLLVTSTATVRRPVTPPPLALLPPPTPTAMAVGDVEAVSAGPAAADGATPEGARAAAVEEEEEEDPAEQEEAGEEGHQKEEEEEENAADDEEDDTANNKEHAAVESEDEDDE